MSVASAALVGEGDDCVVDGRHPRVELLVETAGQEADVGVADGHERPVHGEPFVTALLDDLLEAGRDVGALGAMVSGSGPTCAFLARDNIQALDIAVALTSTGLCRSVKRATGPAPGATVIDARSIA